MFYAHLMNMHFFLPHVYLLSLGLIAWKLLKAAALEFNCQIVRIVHFMIVLPKKTLVKLTLSTLFQLYFQQFYSCFKQFTEKRQNYKWWQIIVFIDENFPALWIARAWSLFLSSTEISLWPGLKKLRATLMDA